MGEGWLRAVGLGLELGWAWGSGWGQALWVWGRVEVGSEVRVIRVIDLACGWRCHLVGGGGTGGAVGGL